jgi:TolB-like protein/DNA-binding winged helix-turn-helix (wHTH) protein/Tfp pilus assembly protein PilF
MSSKSWNMPAIRSQAVAFSRFTLDLARGCLRRGELEIKLRPKSFEVLRYLIENQGRLITKEEIIRAVWTDAFVTDNSLVQCLIEIRQGLGDDSRTIIRTVPRRGYIFDVPVTAVNEQYRLPESGEPSPAAPPLPAQVLPSNPPETNKAESVKRSARLFSNRSRFSLRIVISAAVLVLFFASVILSFRGLRERAFDRVLQPTIRSIVVLPLEGLSRESELDYFADGMTDELITDLSQIEALRVISRTTAMQYKKAKKPLPQIAHELNVDAAIEGTAILSGNRVRITTQLVLAQEDKHLWAQNYERDMKDIIALQDEVARDIVREIKVRVTPRARLTATTPINPEAYEAYLKSRQFVVRRTAEGARRSLEYARRALVLQPDNALLHAELANSLIFMNLMYAAPAREVMPQAKAAVEKALEMDNSLGEAHLTAAMVHFFYDWDFPAAEREFERALQLNPNSAETHSWYGFYLSAMGHHDEAIAEMHRALELDPLSLFENRNVGGALYFARRYDEAVAQFQHTGELDPSYPVVYNWLNRLYNARGMADQAVSWELKNMAANGATPAQLASARALVTNKGAKVFLEKELEGDEKTVPNQTLGALAYNLAGLAASMGHKDIALQYLQRAFDERSFWVPFTKVDPLFDNLRSDSRFQDLVAGLRLQSF